MIYSTFVMHEVVVDLESNCYWTILQQLQSHQDFITSSIETTNVVVSSRKMSWTCLLMARRVFAFIWKTLFIHQSKVFSVLGNEIRKSCEAKKNPHTPKKVKKKRCTVSQVLQTVIRLYSKLSE